VLISASVDYFGFKSSSLAKASQSRPLSPSLAFLVHSCLTAIVIIGVSTHNLCSASGYYPAAHVIQSPVFASLIIYLLAHFGKNLHTGTGTVKSMYLPASHFSWQDSLSHDWITDGKTGTSL